MTKGTFFSVGTGPGDKKLITYRAVEVIKSCDIIAYPQSGASSNAVLKIVEEHIQGKALIGVDMPMTRDKEKLNKSHDDAAEKLADFLDEGKSVAFLTLGDPSIYSTTMYVHKRLEAMGYETEMVSGVTSFCAVAARLNVALCEGGEPLYIIPASYENTDEALLQSGNKVLMKSGKSIKAIKETLSDYTFAQAVECCGMENEKIHKTLDTLDENSSYFSVIVVKP